MADDDLTDTSATGLFNFSAAKIESGWNIGNFAKTGLGLTIIGIFVGIQKLFNAIIGFVKNPLDSAGESIGKLFGGLVGEPATILTDTAQTTATEISATFTGFLGVLAFPAGVASIMLGLWIVTIYLSEQDTSDTFPGSFTDIDTPSWVPFLPDPGVQEEGEDEDRD